MELLATLGSTAWSAVFFVIALSIIVAIHEYGHYIVGRWSGIHAEVFSLGFGPVLFSRVDRRGTRWQVAAIPFGGYVKFLGDVDASSVRSELAPGMAAAERRRTMAGAPLWARAATVAAGPIANFLLTFVVLAGLILAMGIATERPTVGRIVPLPVEQPLREGDVITSLGGMATPDAGALFAAMGADLAPTLTVPATVLRGDQELSLDIPNPQPPRVASVAVKSAAMDAGLREGDVITRAGGQDIATFAQLQQVVVGSEGQPVPLVVWRNGESFDLTLTPRRRDIPTADGNFETRWMVGIGGGLAFEPATRSAGVLETAELAARQMWAMTSATFRGLGQMVVGKISTCNMSGVIGMAQTMGDAARSGTESFISMLAVLSLGVGILNLLPIPVLDGGHLVFHAYEAVVRRPPSERALSLLMSVGMALLLGLMAFALWQDVTCV